LDDERAADVFDGIFRARCVDNLEGDVVCRNTCARAEQRQDGKESNKSAAPHNGTLTTYPK
jgi:hypothetical protein